MHKVYLGLGANLGDRQGNIAQALQWMRERLNIEQVSSCYETEPVGYQEQPDFINVACAATTDLAPQELLRFLKGIEKRMGRQVPFRNAPRPIDIDILLYDDLVLETPELTIPHPRMAERAFVLVPLAEIAPQARHPVLGLTVAELLARVDRKGVRPARRGLYLRLEHDVQETLPRVQVSLSRVGVTNIERIIRIGEGDQENLFYAHMDLFVDLRPRQAGVHMSRFTDLVEQIIEEITLESSPDIETLTERLAYQVVERQHAVRAEVRVRAKYPMTKVAPVSAKRTQELYTLIGIAVCSPAGSRRVVGIEAEGFTVCPCAQDMVQAYSRQLLLEEGIAADIADKVLSLIPIASHNQRGRGTLLIGTEHKIQAADLVSIVENAMSSEIYDLLKRPDEFFVVNKAHRNPRFVEDVVREMIASVIDLYENLPDADFVMARQENFESIHKHNAFAERYGTLGEIRRELRSGEQLLKHTTMEEWLEG